MMIISNCDRDMSFTMAASSFSKPLVGHIAKALKAIPVVRPEDSKKKGTGKLRITSATEIKGKNTKFLEETANAFKTGIASIAVGAKNFVIDKVIDDETILIKENREDYESMENKEYDFFYIPKLDNSSLFKEAYKRLSEDGCICIFPEGTSHDRTDFLKLKAGIALMTLGAMAEGKCKNVNIVPVGLNYFKREEFRSEVVIEFGKPFEVPREWSDLFKTNKRDATEKLLKEVESVILLI
jgi:glycerol-3-phosphate O-acyltransferase/dihydroxyacetone phosphate acyltransferase